MKGFLEKIKKNKAQTVLIGLLVAYFGFFFLTGKGPACVIRDLMAGGAEVSADVVGNPVSLSDMGVEFTTVSGEVITPDSLKGKRVVVNYWATWCPPCRKEIPGFNKIAEKMKEDVVIIGISLDDNYDALAKYLKRDPLAYPVVHGETGLMQFTGGVRSIPTTLFFDQEGIYRGKHVGYLSQSGLAKKVETL